MAASTASILFYKSWDDQGQHPTQEVNYFIVKHSVRLLCEFFEVTIGNRSQPVHDASCNRKSDIGMNC
ncbi:unnamed protein product [Musa acuminata subsp. burmannicoides]